MNEAQMNGTQADETLADETLADGSRSDGPDVEKLRRLRLSGFLRELVRAEGRMEAADLLGVAYRTLVKAEESGEITGRMSDALERLLGTGDDPEVARLRERVGALEERLEGGVESLAKELRDGLDEIRAAVSGKAGAQTGTDGHAQARDGEGAGRSETRAAPPVAGLGSKKPFRERRLDPEIVTVEPDDDDPEVFGDAWPLVEEWRGLRAGHPRRGGNLSWLVTEERLLMLGAGDAGGARADAAAGEAAPAGLRAQGADQLALEGPGGHEGGVEEAEAAALGAPGSSPWGCGGSRPRSRLRGRFPVGATSQRQGSHKGATSQRAIWPQVPDYPVRGLPFGRMFGR